MLTAADRSDKTIRLHLHYLFQLQKRFRWPFRVTEAQLLEVMATPSWGTDARKSARSIYRGFYGWARRCGLVDEDPSVQLPAVRGRRPEPHPTPEPLVWDLVHHKVERIAFMGMLGAFLGMRVGEIALVHSDDWNTYTRRLRVHGKGDKVRVVKVSNPMLTLALDEVEGWAFPNGLGSHLSSGHVSRLLSREQPGDWTGHPLRHRAASTAYEVTGDIYAVRDMLGHVSVDTTLLYTAKSDRRVDAALDAAGQLYLDRAS